VGRLALPPGLGMVTMRKQRQEKGEALGVSGHSGSLPHGSDWRSWRWISQLCEFL